MIIIYATINRLIELCRIFSHSEKNCILYHSCLLQNIFCKYVWLTNLVPSVKAQMHYIRFCQHFCLLQASGEKSK